jgi:hypothetical protein
MRLMALGLCVLAAACSGQLLISPTSPTNAGTGAAQTEARHGNDLPFHGSLTADETDVVAPPNLLVDGSAKGTANQLGRYTATFTVVVALATSTATGMYTFTAANGDQLVATFTGIGVTTEPGIASITETATVVGGSGRFAAAGGTFTIRRVLQQATGESSGSFDGQLSLNR